MALADIPGSEHARRLDSWKEIAEYLGRDVRTATRWEAQGLPLHRVPGGKGSSVFAFTHEIDAWMKGRESGSSNVAVAAVAVEPAPAVAPARAPFRGRLALAGIAAAAAVAAAGMATYTWSAPARDGGLRVSWNAAGISIDDGTSAPRLIHPFDASNGAVLVARAPVRIADVDADGKPDVLAAVSYYERPDNSLVSHGELLNMSPAGEVRWRFAFDDLIEVGGTAMKGPWAVADWQAGPGSSAARIAVAAHDYLWSASMVAIIDASGRRQSTFFNPGWIESLTWLDEDHLAIGGFNNARNEAVMAVIDRARANGQAPGTAGTALACTSCSSTPPTFYAALPRSELNAITAAPFNRARVSVLGDRIVVTTSEMQERETATAIYEFDRTFTLLRATYSESYWDAHKRLELEGRVSHTRANCPERDGPSHISVSSGSDWIRVPSPR